MVRLIVYNLEYCKGNTGLWWQYLEVWKDFFLPRRLDQRIIEHIKKLKPDIVALVEIDTGSFRSKKGGEPLFFENQLGMKSCAEEYIYGAEGLGRIIRYVPILKNHGNAIIAKKRFSEVTHYLLHEGEKRAVIEATIKLKKRVTLLLAHLSIGKKSRAKQIEELIKIVNSIKNPVILMGDFNTFNGEEEIQKLLDKTHLHHKFEMDKKSQTYTFPSYHPKRRLDYVLTSKGIKVKSYEVINFHFSDHLPLLVDFEVR